MSQTTRSLMMKITADASQAEAEVDSLTKKLSGPGSFGFGAGGGGIDRASAAKAESEIRNKVGTFGDIDSALQTFGSITGTTGLQIAGDLFAMGEAAGQLRAALPGLVSNFGGLGLAMGAVGVAVGALVAVMVLANQETSKVVQGVQQGFVARLDAERQYGALSAQEAANLLVEKQKALETEVAINDKATEFRAKTWEQIVADQSATFGIFGDLAARVKLLFAGGTGQLDEAVNKSQQNLADLKAEIAVLGERAGDTAPEVKSAADSFDFSVSNLADSMTTGTSAASMFSNALKTTEEVFKGAASGIAATAKTIVNGRIVVKQQEEEVSDRTELIKQGVEKNLRWIEDSMRNIQDLERKQIDIQNNYRQASWYAERGNDVRAFVNAGEMRQQELNRAQTTFVFNNPNIGSIATPADIETVKHNLTDLLVQVNSVKRGLY